MQEILTVPVAYKTNQFRNSFIITDSSSLELCKSAVSDFLYLDDIFLPSKFSKFILIFVLIQL